MFSSFEDFEIKVSYIFILKYFLILRERIKEGFSNQQSLIDTQIRYFHIFIKRNELKCNNYEYFRNVENLRTKVDKNERLILQNQKNMQDLQVFLIT